MTVIGGVDNRPRGVAVTDATVVPTLAAQDAGRAGAAVHVRFTAPPQPIGDAEVPVASKALQDAEGNLVASWKAMEATNETRYPGVTVPPVALTTGESESATCTVVLNSLPAAEVTVDITAGGNVTVSPTRLTFGTSDWDAAQRVTVSAESDDDRMDDVVTLVHEVASTDEAYNGLDAASVAVTVAGSDGILLSATTLEIDEGGSADYTVVLGREPASVLTVGIYVRPFGDPGFTVEPANPSPAPSNFPLSGTGHFDTLKLITFTPMTWNTPQTVTVHPPAAHDDGVEETATVGHAVAGGDGSLRNVGDLAAKAIDPDAESGAPAVKVSVTALIVPEAGRAAYALGMSGDHTGTVYVNIESSDPAMRVSPATVQFHCGNWEMEQRVTVDAADGAAAATISHAIDGERTRGEVKQNVASIAVTVGPKPMLSVADAEATEGEAIMAFAVALDAGLVILLYKLLSRTGAGGSEKGSRRAVPVR